MKANIEEVLDKFLAAQEKSLKPQTMIDYRDAISLLRDYLNSYAHENLTEEESRLLEEHDNARGGESPKFCRLFGPEKIGENLEMFLDYFLVRKVMAGADFLKKVGSISSRLMKWLGENGYIAPEDAEEGSDQGRTAARNLPRSENAGRILYQAAEDLRIDVTRLPEEDYLEFDHYTIVHLEPGKLWFNEIGPGRSGEAEPVPVPAAATELLEEGWDISCAFARVQGKWRMVEFGNVYPA